jgi:hypothetical protein
MSREERYLLTPPKTWRGDAYRQPLGDAPQPWGRRTSHLYSPSPTHLFAKETCLSVHVVRELVSTTSLSCQPTTTTVERTRRHRFSPGSLARSYRTLWQRRRRFDGVDGKAITRVDALDQPSSLPSSKLVLHRYELADPRQLVSFVAKCPVDPVGGRRHEQDGERPQLAHATEIHP